MKNLILSALTILVVIFITYSWRYWPKNPSRPSWKALAIGALTNFFDTLGIGSFATTTVLFRATKLVDDRLIPGTLNAGHALPIALQAIIFISIVTVDPVTLVAMIVASMLGAWQGANIISRLDKRSIQLGMGLGLSAAALLMLASLLQWIPTGREATQLEGTKFWIGVAANFLFGALMTIGIGAYAPIMVTVSLLGMNPETAFPIMMGSCAFLMPVAARTFIRQKSFDPATTLGLTLGGLPAVAIAAWIVKSLPLDVLKILVISIVALTAVSLFRSYLKGSK